MIECETCHATQVLDLRDYKNQALRCVTCGANFDLDDLKKHIPLDKPNNPLQDLPDLNAMGQQPVLIRTVTLDLRQASQGAQAAQKERSPACISFLAAIVSLGPIAIALAMIFGPQLLDGAGLGTPDPAPERILRGHAAEVNQLGFSPDGRYLLSIGDDLHLRVWDMAGEGNSVLENSESGAPVAFAFYPDGEALGLLGGGGLSWWTFPALEPARSPWPALENNRALLPRALSISADGEWLALAESEVQIWRAGDSSPTTTLDNASAADIAFSPDGQTLLTITWTEPLEIWTRAAGLLAARNPTEHKGEGRLSLAPAVNKVAYLGNKNNTLDDLLVIYDLGAQTEQTISNEDFTTLQSIALSPDGAYVAAGDFFSVVYVYSVADGKLAYKMETPGIPYALSFSPDGARLAAGLDTGEIYLWNLWPAQAASYEVGPTSTPPAFCRIRPLGDVEIRTELGGDRLLYYLREEHQAEVSGQESLNGVVWWQIRGGGWVRSDLVQTDPQTCADILSGE
jgi:hypothetical protein